MPRGTLGLLLALAAGLRFYGLNRVFPIDDEFAQFFTSLTPSGLRELLEAIRVNALHGLIDPLAAFLFGQLSSSTAAIRAPSAIFSLLAVLLIGRLREEKGRVDILAPLLLAISLPSIEWARRADYYSLLVLVTIGTTHAFLTVLERPASWPRAAAWNAAFLLSHPYAIPTAAIQLGFTRWERIQRRCTAEGERAVIKAWLMAGATYLPWFLYSGRKLANLNFFGGQMNPGQGSFSLAEFLASIPAFLSQSPYGLSASPIVWLAAAWAVVLSGAYLASLSAALRQGAPRSLRLAHASLPLGVGVIALLDWIYQYPFIPRQSLWVLPFWLVGAADGLKRLTEKLPRRGLAMIATAAVAFMLPLYRAETEAAISTTGNLERLADGLASRATPGACLSFENAELAEHFLYFYDRKAFGRNLNYYFFVGYNFTMPEPVRAQRAGRWVTVRVDKDRTARECWRLTGRLDNLYAYPPGAL
jgi:hypothetical protein